MKVRLTEAQYEALNKFIEEARAAESPVTLKNLFDDNPNAEYFTIVQRLKTGDDTEYPFKIVDQDGHKGIKDINKMGKTKNCEIDFRPDTMIHGNHFSVSFGSCGTRNINNVIGVKIYGDLESLKTSRELDSMEINHDLNETPEGLADKYYELLKNLVTDNEVYIDSKNKWDGIVISKRMDSIDIELYKHGIPINEDDNNMSWNNDPEILAIPNPKQNKKKKSVILTLDLKTNPFYVDNGKLMLKGVSYDTFNDKKAEFVVPIKKFRTNVGEPKLDRSNGEKSDNNDDDDELNDVKSEEELRKEALIGYKMILNDPILQKAFYRKPSFWNLFISELKGKKAPGKGIVPTLQLLDSYGSGKLNKNLGAEFIQGKRIQFEPYKRPYSIDVDGDTFQLNAGTIYEGTVKKYKFSQNYYVIDSKQGNYGFKLYVKSKTDVESVFKCEFIRYIRDADNKVKQYPHEGDIYIKFSTQSDGYKPLSKSQQKPITNQ